MKSVSYTAVLSIQLHFDEVFMTLRKWEMWFLASFVSMIYCPIFGQ